MEGFRTVVAPQGTALGENQASLLRKSNPRGVVCLLDGDAAGQKAAFDYIPIFLKAGLNARFSTLPEGSDPDQVLLDQGSEGLEDLLTRGVSPIRYAYGHMLRDVADPAPAERKRVSDFLFDSLSKVNSFVEREDHLRELGKVLGASIDNVKRDFELFLQNRRPYQIAGSRLNSQDNSST